MKVTIYHFTQNEHAIIKLPFVNPLNTTLSRSVLD